MVGAVQGQVRQEVAQGFGGQVRQEVAQACGRRVVAEIDRWIERDRRERERERKKNIERLMDG